MNGHTNARTVEPLTPSADRKPKARTTGSVRRPRLSWPGPAARLTADAAGSEAVGVAPARRRGPWLRREDGRAGMARAVRGLVRAGMGWRSA